MHPESLQTRSGDIIGQNGIVHKVRCHIELWIAFWWHGSDLSLRSAPFVCASQMSRCDHASNATCKNSLSVVRFGLDGCP